MKRLSFMFILMILACSGCIDLTGEDSVKVFTLHIPSTYNTANTDNWIIIHTKTGSLIDYKSFESDTTLTFITKKEIPGGKLNITFLQHSVSSGYGHLLDISSYLSVSKGDEWTLSSTTSHLATIRKEIGDFSLSFTDFNYIESLTLTDKHGANYADYLSSSSDQYEGTLDLYEDSGDILLTAASNNNIPKYKFLKDISDKASFNLGFDDLQEFDHVVNFSFPYNYNVYSLLVQGREDDQTYNESSYTTSYFRPGISHGSSVSAGYLNRLSKYKTSLQVRVDNETMYSYYNQGSIPYNVSVPFNAKFELKDDFFLSYSYTNSQPFEYRRSQFGLSYDDYYISWYVTAPPKAAQKIDNLPKEILNLYPGLQPDLLGHSSTFFEISGKSYTDLIDERFKGKVAAETYEYYGVEKGYGI